MPIRIATRESLKKDTQTFVNEGEGHGTLSRKASTTSIASTVAKTMMWCWALMLKYKLLATSLHVEGSLVWLEDAVHR